LLVGGTLNALTGDQQLASAVGFGIGFMSLLLLFMYGPLWLGDPESVLVRPTSNSVFQNWRDAKDESKLQAAVPRCGSVFAMIGGVTAAGANASDLLICIITLGCSILGGLAGYDFKHRVMRRRKHLTSGEKTNS